MKNSRHSQRPQGSPENGWRDRREVYREFDPSIAPPERDEYGRLNYVQVVPRVLQSSRLSPAQKEIWFLMRWDEGMKAGAGTGATAEALAKNSHRSESHVEKVRTDLRKCGWVEKQCSGVHPAKGPIWRWRTVVPPAVWADLTGASRQQDISALTSVMDPGVPFQNRSMVRPITALTSVISLNEGKEGTTNERAQQKSSSTGAGDASPEKTSSKTSSPDEDEPGADEGTSPEDLQQMKREPIQRAPIKNGHPLGRSPDGLQCWTGKSGNSGDPYVLIGAEGDEEEAEYEDLEHPDFSRLDPGSVTLGQALRAWLHQHGLGRNGGRKPRGTERGGDYYLDIMREKANGHPSSGPSEEEMSLDRRVKAWIERLAPATDPPGEPPEGGEKQEAADAGPSQGTPDRHEPRD